MQKKTTKTKWAEAVSKVERYFTPRGKLVIGTLVLTIIGTLGYSAFMGTVSQASSTVMITNMGETSGGSGVIFESSAIESTILTNAHICAVVKSGGIVKTSLHEKYLVDSYTVSPDHDVCLIRIKADLEIGTALASSAPGIMDSASISGHPALLPNVISKGHFGERKVIYLLHSIKKCSQKDYSDPTLGRFCLRFGKLPVFKAYESTVVTATIMGGSSGSAVYNWRNQISGLAFAGNGKGLSFAFVVPYEYVANFVEQVKTSDKHLMATHFKPAYEIGIKDLLSHKSTEDQFTIDVRSIVKDCATVSDLDDPEIKQACSYMENSTLWLKD